MGKAGKARKRQRLERELLLHNSATPASTVVKEGVPHHEGDDDDGDAEEEEKARRPRGVSSNSKEEEGEEEGKVAIMVLDMLSRRLDLWSSKPMKPLRKALFPLISGQHKRNAYFEPPDWEGEPSPTEEEASAILTPDALATLTTVATRISRDDPACFTAAEYKPFRRALHPLVVEFARKEGGGEGGPQERSLSALISTAFRKKDWQEALSLLTRMRMQQEGEEEKPRLGALQRWVRDCDLVAAEGGGGGSKEEEEGKTNMSLLLLDAVLRVAAVKPSPSSSSSSALPTKAVITRHPPFRPPPLPTTTTPPSPPPLDPSTITQGVRVVSHVPGPQRRPPSTHDLNIYATSPGLILPLPSPSSPNTTRRHDVPSVPGAFLMTDVLTPHECRRILTAAETITYSPDAVLGIDCLQWLADPTLLDTIYERCQPHLPQDIDGCRLRGINARWRLFRYYPGAVYRPHIDGAWPGSGFDEKGEYTDDAFHGDRYSRLTFLVYLNGGFEGGGTTFFLPGSQGVGHVEAWSVEPREGAVLCFPHGDARGSLVHEGSAVKDGAGGGAKYVIRTDVLYEVKQAEGRRKG